MKIEEKKKKEVSGKNKTREAGEEKKKKSPTLCNRTTKKLLADILSYEKMTKSTHFLFQRLAVWTLLLVTERSF